MAQLNQAGNLNPTSLLPGVYNRNYGVGSGTPTYTASGGLGQATQGVGHYQWCLTGALPAGFVNTGTNLNNSSTCASPVVEDTATLTANPITLPNPSPTSPGTYHFTIRLDDGGNSAVPSTASSLTLDSTVSTSLQVNPPIVLAQSLGTTWPEAVSGRPYGTGINCVGSVCAQAVYTASNGLGGYKWPGATSGLSGITGLACPAVATGSTTYTCSSADITAAPTSPGSSSHSYSPSVTITDTANAATPAANTTTDPQSMRTDTLVVDAPLLNTLTQNGSTNPSNLIQAVAGRNYGSGNNCSGGNCAAPTYAATGGLGAGVAGMAAYQWCVSSGASSLPAGLGGIGVSCAAYTTTGAAMESLTAAPVASSATPKPYPFTVELDDPGNRSTPSSTGSVTSGLRSTSLAVNPPISFSVNFDNYKFTPNGASTTAEVPDAVQGRTYGAIGSYGAATGGGKTSLIFTATGGLLSTQGLTFTPPASSALPGPVQCGPATGVTYPQVSGSSATMVCSSGGSNLPATTPLTSPASFPFGVTVADAGNASAPPGSVTGDNLGHSSHTLMERIAAGLRRLKQPSRLL